MFTSPSHQRPPLKCGHDFLANRVAILERDYCAVTYTGCKGCVKMRMQYGRKCGSNTVMKTKDQSEEPVNYNKM